MTYSQKKILNTVFSKLLFSLFIFLPISCINNEKENINLHSMAISVSGSDNRPISFTNKEAAFWYTQSHLNDHAEHSFFEGLTIAKEKIFNGYDLFVEGKKLDNSNSAVEVFPHKMVRKHKDGIIEEFWMFDHKNALKVALSNIDRNQKIGIRLKGEDIESAEIENNTVYFNYTNHTYIIAIHSIGRTNIENGNDIV